MAIADFTSGMTLHLDNIVAGIRRRRLGQVALAWRNATADRQRLARAALGIGFATLLIFMQLGFREAFLQSALTLLRAFDADLVIKRATHYQFGQREPFPRRRLYQSLSVPGVASVAPVVLEWEVSRWKSPKTDKTYNIRVVGFDPDRPALLLPEIAARLADLRQPNTAVMDSRSRRHLGDIATGMETELAGRRIRVVGTVSLGPDFFIDGSLFMSERNFVKFFDRDSTPGLRRDDVDFGLLKVKRGYSVSAVKAALVKALPGDVIVQTKDELIDQEITYQGSVSPVGLVFGMGALIGFCVGILIAYQVLFTEISDRLPQYATLKAIGFGRRYLIGVITRQSLIYSFAGFAPAVLITLVIFAFINWAILLPMEMTAGIFWVTLVMTAAMCLVAGLMAARRALAADPAEVF